MGSESKRRRVKAPLYPSMIPKPAEVGLDPTSASWAIANEILVG